MSYAKPAKIIEIRALKQVRSAVESAMTYGFPTLVIGDPGMGKTTALRKIASEANAVYCEVTQQTKTVKGMYRMLLDAFGIHVGSHFTYDLADQCYRRLDNAHGDMPVLLVDEYQAFEPKTLRELLAIHERCGFPLVLCGNKERLAKSRKDEAALAQIENRIGMRFRLGRPTQEDCVQIGVEFNVEGPDAYTALSSYGGNTTVRDLVRLLQMCVTKTGGIGSIQLRHIETAVLGKHSSLDALELLKPAT